MIHITELARMIGASVDELRYLERKGFVQPVRTRLKRREVRQYREDDVSKLENIIRYRRQGFTWDAAYQKAMEALKKPSLFEYR
jgi:DNA-binding transcriptional MerR regulator